MNRINAFLARFVGPNAAHVIDAIVAFALTAAAAAAFSPAARDFELHHARLGVALALAPAILTALASKFRKAAGQPANDLVDAIAAAVRAELTAAQAAPADRPALEPPPR